MTRLDVAGLATTVLALAALGACAGGPGGQSSAAAGSAASATAATTPVTASSSPVSGTTTSPATAGAPTGATSASAASTTSATTPRATAVATTAADAEFFALAHELFPNATDEQAATVRSMVCDAIGSQPKRSTLDSVVSGFVEQSGLDRAKAHRLLGAAVRSGCPAYSHLVD